MVSRLIIGSQERTEDTRSYAFFFSVVIDRCVARTELRWFFRVTELVKTREC